MADDIHTLRSWIMIVEAASPSRPKLYHVTSQENVDSICRSGFRASAKGEIGPGVYLINNPAYLSDKRFQDGVSLPVDVTVPLLVAKDGVNRVLAILRALYGASEGARIYDATPSKTKFDWSGTPNWSWLHGLVRDAGYGGIQLTDHGSAKNTVIFDADDVIPRVEKTRKNITESDGLTGGQVREFGWKIADDLQMESFDLFLTHAGDIKLNMIKVEKGNRRKGIGTAAMERLCAFADLHQLRIVLSPAITDRYVGTTSRGRLVTFYKRFGFHENKGRKKDFSISEGMIRDPR